MLVACPSNIQEPLCNLAHMSTLLLSLCARADATNIDGSLVHFLEMYVLMQHVKARCPTRSSIKVVGCRLNHGRGEGFDTLQSGKEISGQGVVHYAVVMGTLFGRFATRVGIDIGFRIGLGWEL